jgi:KDO2-lipid IV(A) lauroyltransferase
VASWLAVKTGAALVPVFTLPLADGRYRFIYEKALDKSLHTGPDRRQTVQELTQLCGRILEGYVRRNPEFWLWQHRRWKTRPVEEGRDPLVLPAGKAG